MSTEHFSHFRSEHKTDMREKVAKIAGTSKHHEFHADKAHRFCEGGATHMAHGGGLEGTGLPDPEKTEP